MGNNTEKECVGCSNMEEIKALFLPLHDAITILGEWKRTLERNQTIRLTIASIIAMVGVFVIGKYLDGVSNKIGNLDKTFKESVVVTAELKEALKTDQEKDKAKFMVVDHDILSLSGRIEDLKTKVTLNSTWIKVVQDRVDELEKEK